jgi:hypothetical protein
MKFGHYGQSLTKEQYVQSDFDPEIDDESRNGPVLVSGPTSVTLLVLIITQIGISTQSTEVQHQQNYSLKILNTKLNFTNLGSSHISTINTPLVMAFVQIVLQEPNQE